MWIIPWTISPYNKISQAYTLWISSQTCISTRHWVAGLNLQHLSWKFEGSPQPCFFLCRNLGFGARPNSQSIQLPWIYSGPMSGIQCDNAWLVCLRSSNSRGGKVHNLSAPSAENETRLQPRLFVVILGTQGVLDLCVCASTNKGYPPLVSSISPPHLICGFDTRWSVSTSRTSSNFGSKRTLTMCPETNHMLLGAPQLTFTHRKAQTLYCFYFHIVFYIQNYPNIAISNKKRYLSPKTHRDVFTLFWCKTWG